VTQTRGRHLLPSHLDDAIAEAMNPCAAPLPFSESERVRAGLHAAPSPVVKPPRIAEAPASLECVV